MVIFCLLVYHTFFFRAFSVRFFIFLLLGIVVAYGGGWGEEGENQIFLVSLFSPVI